MVGLCSACLRYNTVCHIVRRSIFKLEEEEDHARPPNLVDGEEGMGDLDSHSLEGFLHLAVWKI